MPDLNLGVISVPYENEGQSAAPRITKKGHVHKGSAKRLARQMQTGVVHDDGPNTTVSVATALEEKYHVMGVFYEHFQDEIGAAMVHSMEGALEDLYAGAPMHDPYAEAGQEIAQGFRQFLLQAEIETYGIEGVPTKASIERRSERFKSGVGPAQRPSFISTGTYELAFRAWIE